MEKRGHNGFLMGLLVGGAVGALVSTKKGRQILKDIADYGLEYIGKTIDIDDFESILDDEEEMMSGEFDADDEESAPPKPETEKKEEVKESNPEPQRRRLFRGIRKK